jgi:hypothetical protein
MNIIYLKKVGGKGKTEIRKIDNENRSNEYWEIE